MSQPVSFLLSKVVFCSLRHISNQLFFPFFYTSTFQGFPFIFNFFVKIYISALHQIFNQTFTQPPFFSGYDRAFGSTLRTGSSPAAGHPVVTPSFLFHQTNAGRVHVIDLGIVCTRSARPGTSI